MIERGIIIASVSTDTTKTETFLNTDFLERLWSKVDSNEMKDSKLNSVFPK